MKNLMRMSAVALAAATMITALLPAPARAADEGRSTIMWLVIDFVPHARPKWGSVGWIWLAPTIQYASFAECQAATQTANWRYQQRTEAYVSRWAWQPGYNNQIVCYSAKATSTQDIAWDVCDRAGLGFRFAKACQFLTYGRPDHVRELPTGDYRMQRLKRILRR